MEALEEIEEDANECPAGLDQTDRRAAKVKAFLKTKKYVIWEKFDVVPALLEGVKPTPKAIFRVHFIWRLRKGLYACRIGYAPLLIPSKVEKFWKNIYSQRRLQNQLQLETRSRRLL